MKRISVNIDNATTLTWEEEHKYLKPSDVVKLPSSYKNQSEKEE